MPGVGGQRDRACVLIDGACRGGGDVVDERRQLEEDRSCGQLPAERSVTDRPVAVIFRAEPPAVGGREIGDRRSAAPWRNHWPGRRGRRSGCRPIARATSESSRTLLASAIPQACGEEPCPAPGWLPIHGVSGTGPVELSHHEYGPLWLLPDHELVARGSPGRGSGCRPDRRCRGRRCRRSSSSRRGNPRRCPGGSVPCRRPNP